MGKTDDTQSLAETYDYIIVGAGSSGCVLANLLSADPSVSILLIEAGPDDASPLIAMPRGLGKLHQRGDPHVQFYTARSGGNRPDEVWFKGRTLGGSSSINGMVYVRGAPRDYDGWEQAGCAGWGWRSMAPCFVALEDHELGASDAAPRGAGGPLAVSVHPTRHVLTEAVLDAAAQLGVPRVADINDVEVVQNGGVGYLTRTINKGRRVSAASAFLTPARGRENLRVATGVQVETIVFDGTRATGLRVQAADGARVVRAGREIILCAGALESPRLLQLAGIGPAGLLTSLGIPVIVDAPDVGQNLRDHRYMPMSYRVRAGSLNGRFRGLGLVASVVSYLAARRGPLTHAAHEAAGFIKTRAGLSHADAQLGIGLYTIKLTPRGHSIGDGAGMTIGGYITQPQSTGTVRITSSDPRAALHIDANAYAHAADRAGGIALVRWVRLLAEQPALRGLIEEELVPGPDVHSDDEIALALLQFGSTTFHVSGTCRMGADAAAVVDTDLRVHGVQGLRVCDTSIFPTLPSGNTSAPAMAVAMRLGQKMTGR